MPIDSIGATGAVVARNISRLRRDQGLAYTELSKRLSELGRPIPTLGLRKIESGGRRVDVDDVIALSLALAVSPITLFMPYPLDDAGELLDVPGVREPQEASQRVAQRTRSSPSYRRSSTCDASPSSKSWAK